LWLLIKKTIHHHKGQAGRSVVANQGDYPSPWGQADRSVVANQGDYPSPWGQAGRSVVANQGDYPSPWGQAGRSCSCQPRRLSVTPGTGWQELQLPTKKAILNTRDRQAGAPAANQEAYPSHQGQAGRSCSCQPRSLSITPRTGWQELQLSTRKTIHHTRERLERAFTL
jgi:hypothetical protein